jgi:hypothetical protein
MASHWSWAFSEGATIRDLISMKSEIRDPPFDELIESEHSIPLSRRIAGEIFDRLIPITRGQVGLQARLLRLNESQVE